MPRPRAQYSGSRSLASLAMPIFTYVAVVGSVLIALLFVVNPSGEGYASGGHQRPRRSAKALASRLDTHPRRRPGTRT